MHHISDPNHRLYPSSNFVARSNVFTVDCLFHEAKGFFKSTANDTAVEQTLEHMRKYAKTSSKRLREKIRDISSTAAENLSAAGISDAQILTLTLPELIELLPGIQNFQTRREIMALISQHCEKSSKSLREKISDISSTAAESLRAAGISDARILTLTLPELIELLPRIQNIEGQVTGVLLEQRQVLKGLERQLQAALDTIRPYLELLDKLDKEEELTRTQLCDGNKSLEGVASFMSDLVKVHIVGEIGRNVFLKNLGVRILECNLEQCSVILILWPASSGFEIKAELSKIPDNKEAILVLMHTFYPRQSMDATRQKGNIVETVNYLLYQSTREFNEQAISRVRSALERYGRE
ncbi:hypothetical protein SKAU_G00186020 [Synaphobranchus kaupii]|uniref:Uncharacterized protein n=1 Tax=Synaphobranchus kaupii TaxID=118154 RepID=A0A9Q1IWS4_SYNKA|nr:hypothetical protein SKAU_G00186020 [Synaphobranchus kaupii]